MRPITKIILHCTDSPNPRQRIEDIRRYHMAPPPHGRGWKDVGYHYLICMDGLLQLGRPLNDDPYMDAKEIGAHAEGYNKDSIGIALAGKDNFRPVQFDTLYTLLTLLKKRCPGATLHGHREFSKQGKTCPNFDYSDLVKWWSAYSGA